MESLKEVLMRVKGFSEEDAISSIEEAKTLIESGNSPESVLVSLYGDDVVQLESLLSPVMSTI